MFLKSDISKVIKTFYGIIVEPSALSYLHNVLLDVGLQDLDRATEEVHKIFTLLFRKFDDLEILSKKEVESVMEDYLVTVGRKKEVRKVTDTAFLHVDTMFDMEQLSYDRQTNQYLRTETQSKRLLGNAAQKIAVYRNRFENIRQRLMRNDSFKAPVFMREIDANSAVFKITPLKNLQGCGGGSFLLFGMLFKSSEGSWILEDMDSDIQLDLSNAVFGEGIFAEGCFVLALGTYENEKFIVEEISHPPTESRLKTLSYFPVFKRESSLTPDIIELFKKTEEDPNQCIVYMSDTWLDDIQVLESIKKLLGGYEDAGIYPVAFIMMGNFIGEDKEDGVSKLRRLRDAFMELGRIIKSYPKIQKNSHFILVPGPGDGWASNIDPKPGFPESITKGCFSKTTKVHFPSNPCRIRYCTQEYLVYRENIADKLLRNSCSRPTSESAMSRHVSVTLASQGTVSPLLNNIAPTYWPYAHVMDMNHLPDAVFVGDKLDPFKDVIDDCCITNAGSFRITNFQFMAYYPAYKTAEISQVP